jgi:NAD+ kinase
MRKIGIVANTSKPNWLQAARSIVDFLLGRGLEVLVEPENAREALFGEQAGQAGERLTESDMVFSLGGDGTFLSAVRLVGHRDVPIAGVNLGGLGFLAEFSASDFLSSLDRILAGDYRIQERMTLKASLARQGESVREERALNDVVISTTGVSRLATLRASIDNEYLTTYQSNGLIVATPTGSTAYSLSAGGPIVDPALEALLLTPICPHALSNRPILVPPHRTIRIDPLKIPGAAVVTVDGQTVLDFLGDDVLTVRSSEKRIKLITTNEASYFEILRSKLGWGGSKGNPDGSFSP